ncbi:hypothetical protein [Sphingomonas beigongshangi]|uniref:hypothetical protein n=1 Tax=Sphingomonas beigongshangi TaxID=2782540 RepID=UPI00193BF570|nr:hypothetical protein [Sphingomonas beigongshangi]
MTDTIIFVLATVIIGTLILDVRTLKRELSDQSKIIADHYQVLRGLNQYVGDMAAYVLEQDAQTETVATVQTTDDDFACDCLHCRADAAEDRA